MKGDLKIRERLTSLRSRYGFFLLALIVVIVILNLISLFTMDRMFYSYMQKALIADCKEIEEICKTPETMYKDLANYESANNVYIEIYRPRDNLIYSTNSNDWLYQSGSDSKNDKDDLKPRTMKILNHKDVDEMSYFEDRQEYYAQGKYLVYSKGNSEYTYELYYSYDTLNNSSKTAKITLFLMSIIFLVIVVGLSLAYVFAFVFPLEKINSVTKKMAKIEFDEQCPNFRVKELDELSDSVNALSASLNLTLKDLVYKNKMLEQGIEKEKKLDEARKQFIDNASHELKTPLTIIQGYAEGLKFSIEDGNPEEYCDIIIDEAQKMNKLVLRLLEAMRYEENGNLLNQASFSIYDFLNEYLTPMKKYIEQNGISLNVDCDKNFFGYGDRDVLFDVLGNYISNAVSHCSGEKRISVTATEHDSVFKVSVFNTGETIAPEDIDHIWDSFYRADKSHSRAQGRFGLGLSIVSLAQKQHSQKYGVTNRENGVEFWFNIAKGKNESK